VVLRFLAEDVGKELDLVLDTILRSLTGDRKAVSSDGGGGGSLAVLSRRRPTGLTT